MLQICQHLQEKALLLYFNFQRPSRCPCIYFEKSSLDLNLLPGCTMTETLDLKIRGSLFSCVTFLVLKIHGIIQYYRESLKSEFVPGSAGSLC